VGAVGGEALITANPPYIHYNSCSYCEVYVYILRLVVCIFEYVFKGPSKNIYGTWNMKKWPIYYQSNKKDYHSNSY
jgi:hypothetical protein